MKVFWYIALSAAVGQLLFAVAWAAYLGPQPNSNHSIGLVTAVLGLMGLAAYRWPALRWGPAVLNGLLALALLVPLAMVILEWLGPGGDTMAIDRWGETQRTSPLIAIPLVLTIWCLFAAAAIGFGLGRFDKPRANPTVPPRDKSA